MIRLALTDLDNTLIPSGRGCASAYAREAMHEALGAGIRVGPVTGRAPLTMRGMFEGDSCCYDTGIFINGQIIYLDGKVMCEQAIDGSLLEDVACYIRPWDGVALALYDISSISGISDGPVTYVGITESELERHKGFFEAEHTLLDHVEGSSYLKVNLRVNLTDEEFATLEKELQDRFRDLSFVRPISDGPFIDIQPKGLDKGEAVCHLLDYLDLEPEEVVVFGDSENDLSMFEDVPNSVAVRGATSEVAAAARYHIGACADDAVADAMRELVHAGGDPSCLPR